ncbi:MAG: VCBS repeat-containing protein, partial [Acetobacteraceae bacterium]|nr:VCBS repeat-containing protein [Acetobacteraceae bacterium]
NGDGKSDILWQSDDGSVAIWEMNGTAIVGGGNIQLNPGPSWHVKGTGDFNGDGKSDILWQSDDGSAAIWQMDGTTIIGGGNIPLNPGSPWHMTGSDGMRFINATSSTGTLTATSEPDEFVLTTHLPGALAIAGFNAAQDIIALSKASFANFAALLAHSTTSGGSTMIALDRSSSLTILGIAPGSLHASNFAFV